MKSFTIMTGIDLRKKVNGGAYHFKGELSKVCEAIPDLYNSQALATLYDLHHVKHIVICIYRDKKGAEQRRIAGLPVVPEGNEEVGAVIKQVGKSLGIDIERTLVDMR